MNTHNICFHREIRKICGYPLLSVAMPNINDSNTGNSFTVADLN